MLEGERQIGVDTKSMPLLWVSDLLCSGTLQI